MAGVEGRTQAPGQAAEPGGPDTYEVDSGRKGMGTLNSLLHRTATGPDHHRVGKGILSHTSTGTDTQTDTQIHSRASFPDIMTLVYTHFSMWLIFFFFFLVLIFFSKKKATRK